ncbi:hypothetical protein Cni_G14250 [Canna indica]|uniref:Uncharacterized protein n=1 Tax=Canna indica TaxID=4628 RepID=A0AAQ3QDH2_9LILI|nr:hypothetical protein Cni_G14250 [Canna indica]
MAVKMLAKFAKYWSEFSVILSIAVILDPRYKLQFVDWSYKKLYGSHSREFETIQNKLFSLYEEYASSRECGSSMSSPPKGQSGSHCDQEIQEKDMLEEFDVYEGDEYSIALRKSELEKYLDETRIDRKTELDILCYWKINGQRYPIVARMARDILSIPLSTVASESAFSCGVDTEMSMDELIEDVMSLNISDEPSTQDSTTHSFAERQNLGLCVST